MPQPNEERESRRMYYRPAPRYIKVPPDIFAAAFTCIGMAVAVLIILACANRWWGLHW